MEQEENKVTVHDVARMLMEPVYETNYLGNAMAHLNKVLPMQSPDGNQDFYAEQVNGYGIALLMAQHYTLAEQLWRLMARRTVAWRYEHAWPQNLSSWRHAGAFYGNAALACALQGKVEEALILWIHGAKEDEITHHCTLMESHGIREMYRVHFREPVIEQIEELLRHTQPYISRADLDTLAMHLGEQQFELLVYLKKMHTCVSESFVLHHPAMDDLVFQCLRNIGPFVDRHLKSVADKLGLSTKGTMQNTIVNLYRGKGVIFASYETTHAAITTKTDRVGNSVQRSIKEQIEEVWKQPTNSDEEKFIQSLHIAHIVRNHAAHDERSDLFLLRTKVREVIAHMLHVLRDADKYA